MSKIGWIFTECVYCGREARAFDHIRAQKRGGSDDETNLVPVCQPCNSSKHSKLLTEWDPIRVAHGVLRDPRVKAEWDSLVRLQKRSPILPGGARRYVTEDVLQWRSVNSETIFEHDVWLVTPPQHEALAVVLESEDGPGVMQNMAETVALAVEVMFPGRVTVLHYLVPDTCSTFDWWHAVPIVDGKPDFWAGTEESVIRSLFVTGLMSR